jgi:LAGLIDADG DNA endonuclease family
MNPWQKQIVVGTILGGSSIVKPKKGINYYLAMAGKDSLWLQYKMAELNDLFPKANLNLDGNTYRCASRCSESLSAIHTEMYTDGVRNIPQDALDGLRDIALAIWYLDGGGKTGRDKKNAYLNLTRMPNSVDRIENYFCSMNMHCNANNSKNRIRLVFSLEGTTNLLKSISHRFPSFMYHRL